MEALSVKERLLKTGIQIFGIWTLVALSMSIQMYLTSKHWDPGRTWWSILGKQLITWYLCALLTPVVMYFYNRYPLDTPQWKKNLATQSGIALLVLIVFSIPRAWVMHYISKRNPWELSSSEHLNFYLAQIAWDFAIYTFIVTTLFADKTHRKRKENELLAAEITLRNKELESQLKAAQLEALKLQLSPHFLFNTLNTINALIRSGEYALAIQINTRLGDFLRTTLYADHSQLVTLEKEMEFIDLYLGIESLRFSDRLKVIKQIPEDCSQIRVPYFILQPVIENAIKHGISQQSTARLLEVKAERKQNQLLLTVFNEGKLTTPHWQSAKGIGLKNVVKRLDKIYGSSYSFSLDNLIDQQGVQVQLSIPLN